MVAVAVCGNCHSKRASLVSHQWHLVVNCGATNYLLIYAKGMMSHEMPLQRQQQQLA